MIRFVFPNTYSKIVRQAWKFGDRQVRKLFDSGVEIIRPESTQQQWGER